MLTDYKAKHRIGVGRQCEANQPRILRELASVIGRCVMRFLKFASILGLVAVLLVTSSMPVMADSPDRAPTYGPVGGSATAEELAAAGIQHGPPTVPRLPSLLISSIS